MKGGPVGLQNYAKFITKFSHAHIGTNPFEEFERKLTKIGFFLLILGFAIQVYANYIQL
jgi:hypothetical protein